MKEIETLYHYLQASQRTIVVTGAGISNSSGIKDMERMDTLEILQTTFEPLVRLHPNRSYRLLHKHFLEPMLEQGPSLTHQVLAELEQAGMVQGIITTNIDHLHSLAGSKQVAEIQGSYALNRCAKCHTIYRGLEVWQRGSYPRCAKCGGLVLAFPVYSHVGLEEEAYQQACDWVATADLLLIIGSKGNYGSYLAYRPQTSPILQINPQATQFDDLATLTIRRDSDDVFAALQGLHKPDQ
ncbi:TPA: NAD-dependent deacetylase [Streptococcus suis]